MPEYYRTFYIEGNQDTHLGATGMDTAICGQDTFGDSLIYSKDPQRLDGENHRVTCNQCLQIIRDCIEHHDRSKKPQPNLSEKL